jgi:hypothetical protein
VVFAEYVGFHLCANGCACHLIHATGVQE